MPPARPAGSRRRDVLDRIARGLMWFDDLVLRVTLIVCGSLLLSMVVIQALGVVFRFILHSSLSWSDEVSSYLFVWLTCLGAAAGVKLRVHPEIKALAGRVAALYQNRAARSHGFCDRRSRPGVRHLRQRHAVADGGRDGVVAADLDGLSLP